MAGTADLLMKSGGPLKRKTELKPGGPLKRGGRLNPVSEKQKHTRAAIQKACPLGPHCVACGTNQALTRSHILTVKMHPHQAANPLNVLTLCWPDHCIWENDKPRFRQMYPAVFALKMERMRALDPQQATLTLQKLRS